MTRFDRFVLARFFAAFGLLLALLIVTFVVLDYVERVDDFMDRGAAMSDVFGTYYLHYVPEIIRLVSPLAAFLAAIFVTSRLAQSMQLAALRAAGISTLRFARPIALGGALIAVVMLGFNGWIVPRAVSVVHDFQNRYYRDAPERSGGSASVRQIAADAILSVGFFDREAARAYRVTAIQFDTTSASSGVRARLDAAEMEWLDSLATWRLQRVSTRSFAAGGSVARELPTLDSAFALHPRDLAETNRDTERMTLPEARAFVQTLSRTGVREIGRPVVAYHAKLAYPLANFILAILAVPMASRRRRGGQAAQLAIGLGVAVVYLGVQKTMEPLGFVGDIPPELAAWAPHVLFGALALVALARMRRV